MTAYDPRTPSPCDALLRTPPAPSSLAVVRHGSAAVAVPALMPNSHIFANHSILAGNRKNCLSLTPFGLGIYIKSANIIKRTTNENLKNNFYLGLI